MSGKRFRRSSFRVKSGIETPKNFYKLQGRVSSKKYIPERKNSKISSKKQSNLKSRFSGSSQKNQKSKNAQADKKIEISRFLPKIIKSEPASRLKNQNEILKGKNSIILKKIGEKENELFFVGQALNLDFVNTLFAKCKSTNSTDENKIEHLISKEIDPTILNLCKFYFSISTNENDYDAKKSDFSMSEEEIFKNLACCVVSSFNFTAFNLNRRQIRILFLKDFESFKNLTGIAFKISK